MGVCYGLLWFGMGITLTLPMRNTSSQQLSIMAHPTRSPNGLWIDSTDRIPFLTRITVSVLDQLERNMEADTLVVDDIFLELRGKKKHGKLSLI